MFNTIPLYFFDFNYYLDNNHRLASIAYKYNMFLNCLRNYFIGEKYRDKQGNIFTYKEWTPYLLAGSPIKAGYDVDYKYWFPINRGMYYSVFQGFFDYSQGRWVHSKREIEERCRAEGKVFASDAEIAQEAGRNKQRIANEQKAETMAQGKEIVRKNFTKWRKEFNAERAKDTYNQIVDANKKLANAEIDDFGNPKI